GAARRSRRDHRLPFRVGGLGTRQHLADGRTRFPTALSLVPSEPRDANRREQLVALCRRLPDASAERAGVDHLAFKVRKKIFAYYTYDHHGDGMIAFLCKAPPGEQGRLVKESPRRYFVPHYVGPKGWVGLRLDMRCAFEAS